MSILRSGRSGATFEQPYLLTMPTCARPLTRLAPFVLAIAVCAAAACSGGDAGGSVSPGGGSGGSGGNGESSGSSGSGTVQTGSFPSAALGITKQYVVYLPPSYATQPTRRFPVVYILHGLGGTETDWLTNMSVNTVLDSLAHAGLPEVIAVLADGDSWWYHDWVSTPPSCSGGSYTGSAPSEPCVPGLHYQYEEYIVNDLVGHVDATYRTQADMSHRAIAGQSMGGYGAAYLSLAHPDLFNVAAVFSGARLELLATTDPTTGATRPATSIAEVQAAHPNEWANWSAEYGTTFANWQAHDPSSLAAALASAGRRVPPMWIIVGTGDALHPTVEYFNSVLTKIGATHVFSEPSGDHSDAFWRAHEGDGFAWVLQHIGS